MSDADSTEPEFRWFGAVAFVVAVISLAALFLAAATLMTAWLAYALRAFLPLLAVGALLNIWSWRVREPERSITSWLLVVGALCWAVFWNVGIALLLLATLVTVLPRGSWRRYVLIPWAWSVPLLAMFHPFDEWTDLSLAGLEVTTAVIHTAMLAALVTLFSLRRSKQIVVERASHVFSG